MKNMQTPNKKEIASLEKSLRENEYPADALLASICALRDIPTVTDSTANALAGRGLLLRRNKTRVPGLGFAKVCPGLWRFIDLATGATIGAHYARKDELLCDVSRFAAERGLI